MQPTTTTRRTVLKTLTAAAGLGLTTGAATAAPGNAHGRRHDVTIRTSHDHDTGEHGFHLSRQTFPAGWTTFTLENASGHTHFAYLAKLPPQALVDAAANDLTPLELYVETVTRPFQYYWDTLVPGKTPDPDDIGTIYASFFPPWFGDVQFYGGPGLASPGIDATTTVALDPGVYILECYVKDPANDFHSYHGMIEQLTVTDDHLDAPEPTPTLAVTVATAGITAPHAVRPGRHIVGVTFADQQVYPNLVGHDLHLVRLDGDTTAQDVNDWMNWADPNQLVSDGSEPTTFLGGVNDIWTTALPATGYMHVDLRPGDYVWVAEVPDPVSHGLLHAFTVPGRPN